MTTLSTKDYAALVGVSQRTVQRWIKDGSLFAERTNGKYRVDEAETRSGITAETTPVQTPAKTDERGLTTKEYAELVGVSQRTIQRWIKADELFAEKVGNRYIIPDPTQSRRTPQSEYAPEQFDDSTDDDYPITDESDIPPDALRKEFAELSDAQDYADQIPVITKIIRNRRGLFRVLVIGSDVMAFTRQDDDDDDESTEE